MKRFYFLTILFAFIPYLSTAQGTAGAVNVDLQPTVGDLTQQHLVSALKKRKQQKAYRDTLFYDDFDFSAPLNWTIVNSSGPNGAEPWKHVPAGSRPWSLLSPNTGPLQSTSDTNGYMYLVPDSTIPFSNLTFDTQFTSNAISISPTVSSVIVKFEQALLWCCSPSSQMVLEVSTDNLNWTSFDASAGLGGNQMGPNGQLVEIDVSAVLANQPTAYLRFRATGITASHWMIDDVLVYEGPANNVELLGTQIDFHPGYALVPQYYTVPLSNIPLTGFSGIIKNGGGNTATNVNFMLDVEQDSLIGGGAGSGSVYQDTVQVGSGTLQPAIIDTAALPNQFFVLSPAHYSFNFSVSSDSINDQPSEATATRPVTLTLDTVVALERGEAFFQGSDGPGAYAQSSGIGDALAALVVIDNFAKDIRGVSFWVDSANAADLAGIALSPRIWGFDESKVIQNGQLIAPIDSGITGIVAQSPFSVTIDSCTASCPTTSIVNSWVNLNFLAPVNLQPGTYYFGIEQTGGSGRIMGSKDPGAEAQATLLSNIMYLGGANSWGWGNFVVGLRMYFDYIRPGLNEDIQNSNLSAELYPNPNNGLFTMEINNAGATTYMMNVRNTIGQTVMSEAINVNGSVTKNIDLTSFEKGVYFVTLENGDERLVRKVVVK